MNWWRRKANGSSRERERKREKERERERVSEMPTFRRKEKWPLVPRERTFKRWRMESRIPVLLFGFVPSFFYLRARMHFLYTFCTFRSFKVQYSSLPSLSSLMYNVNLLFLSLSLSLPSLTSPPSMACTFFIFSFTSVRHWMWDSTKGKKAEME